MKNPRSNTTHPWSEWRDFYVLWPRKIEGVWCWFEWVEVRHFYKDHDPRYKPDVIFEYRLITEERKVKACKDCVHCLGKSHDLPICELTAIYKTKTNYVTGTVEEVWEYIEWCFAFRKQPTILGGCGKRAKYFKLKEVK